MDENCSGKEGDVGTNGGHYLEFSGRDESGVGIDVDKLMKIAYGEPLRGCGSFDRSDVWYKRWKTLVFLQSKHYEIPGGAIGRRYVDLLSEEVSQVGAGNYSSDRVIAFSALMLQRDRMIKRSCDVRRVIERRMDLWKNQEFNVLLQEAIRCDKSLKNTRKSDMNKDHVTKVFTKLMLQGKIRAAVRWLSEKARGGILHPMDQVESKVSVKLQVWEVLRNKHPNPSIPSNDPLIENEVLPEFEDVEICRSHVLKVVRQIQGGTGPGGCDAIHWQDALLPYGAHSGRLRESVATLCRRLANTIVPWEDVRSLVSSRLIAIDKCPGVRPIWVGESLRRMIGKVICLATELMWKKCVE